MKRIRQLTSKILLLVVFAFLLLPTQAIAQDDKDKKVNRVLPADEIVEEDYFTAGDNVTLSGTINGDAYVAGGNVLIDGTINGDLLVAGGMITINGEVTQDVRVVGGQVNISGTIGRNISVVGGSVNLNNGANLAGSLTSVGGNISLFAPVNGNVNLVGGQATIDSAINGSVKAAVGKIVLTPRADIAGDLTVWSEEEITSQPGATVAGETERKILETDKIQKDFEPPFKPGGVFALAAGGKIAFGIIGLLSSWLIGLLLINFCPNRIEKVVKEIRDQPWRSIGTGFLAIVVVPIAFIILLVTIVGAPLALMAITAFAIFSYLAKIFVALLLGRWLLDLVGVKPASGWALLAGLIIYYLISILPLISGLFTFSVTLIGLGASLMVMKRFYHTLRSKKLI